MQPRTGDGWLLQPETEEPESRETGDMGAPGSGRPWHSRGADRWHARWVTGVWWWWLTTGGVLMLPIVSAGKNDELPELTGPCTVRCPLVLAVADKEDDEEPQDDED